MTRMLSAQALIFAVAGISPGCGTHPSNASIAQQLAAGRDPETLNLEADSQMAVPISRARETVGEFVEAVTSVRDENTRYAFRVMLGEDGVNAHVWVELGGATHDELAGKVISVPPEWKSWQPGQGISAQPRHIFDWRIVKDGVVKGAFTTRAIRKLMTADQRRHFDERTRLKFD